jgi:hypothetical protein
VRGKEKIEIKERANEGKRGGVNVLKLNFKALYDVVKRIEWSGRNRSSKIGNLIPHLKETHTPAISATRF